MENTNKPATTPNDKPAPPKPPKPTYKNNDHLEHSLKTGGKPPGSGKDD